MKYINIHTHHKKNSKNCVEVLNYFANKNIDGSNLCSVGLHPWHILDTDKSWVGKINELVTRNNVIAIGETGLDRVSQVNFELQKEVFLKHIKISEETNTPLIIHCVKAHSDILWFRKEYKVFTPWIIHGFTGNQQTANELIKHGCYLSFGKSILNPNNKVIGYFAELPIEKIFLETDDDPKISIEEVYQQAANLLKYTDNDLKKQIYLNFEKLFPGILDDEQLAAED